MARSSVPQKREVAVEHTRVIPWKGILVVAVIALGLAALVAFDPDPPGVTFPNLGNQHIVDPGEAHAPYNSAPPSSGPHLGQLAEWGVHEILVPEELFIHNMEDGGVVLTYDCPDGCDDLVAGLTDIVNDGSRRVLTPFTGIENDGVQYRGAAAVWTKVYYFDELTDEVRGDIETFIGLYEGVDHHASSN